MVFLPVSTYCPFLYLYFLSFFCIFTSCPFLHLYFPSFSASLIPVLFSVSLIPVLFSVYLSLFGIFTNLIDHSEIREGKHISHRSTLEICDFPWFFNSFFLFSRFSLVSLDFYWFFLDFLWFSLICIGLVGFP